MAVMLVAALLPCLGCSNRAHSDLYQQRMASEIRVLEDQLYDADYQNQVLADKVQQLERSKKDCDPEATNYGPPAPTETHPAPQPYVPEPVPGQMIYDDAGIGAGLETELELPSFDEGTPVAPDEIESPPGVPIPLRDPKTDLPTGDEATDRLLPAPGGPEPPSMKDTIVPQVEEGPILPPPSKEEGESNPPNQIILPDSVQAAAGTPTGLRLHPGLSGGSPTDGEVDEITIVVSVVDDLNKAVDLEKFDVDAEMSVVILDPEREGDEARIGRWDFTAEEVKSMIQSSPVSGFHVPIRWDKHPLAEEVIAHVRLRAEDDEMRCHDRLKITKKAIIADWTPRGESLR